MKNLKVGDKIILKESFIKETSIIDKTYTVVKSPEIGENYFFIDVLLSNNRVFPFPVFAGQYIVLSTKKKIG